MSLDLRTRYDEDVEAVDVVELFEDRLPRLSAERSFLAVPGARELGIRPLTIETPVGSWTLSIAGDEVGIAPGSGSEAVVRLDESELADIVYDLRTPMTLFTAGTLDIPRGRLEDVLDWWVVLRSLLDGRPVHTAGSVEFRDRSGEPLDLHHSFPPDDDPAEARHFLSEAGYLHLTDVFTREEMQQVSDDMDAALPSYQPDDGRSWWATTAGGERRPVRLQWFQDHSPTTASILEDDRLLRIASLAAEGHRRRSEGNLIEALVKPIGVVEGISDVPWHKDCSLGRHSYQCCGLTVGISVTGADEQSGQLAVVAGSHRALVQPAFFRRSWGLPVVPLPTRTGDITVHCSCTMHMSHPPIERERRVMYTGFGLPPRPGDSTPRNANDLSRVRERAYKTVNQAPGFVR
jgi:Phytanoyl-CoA dioxygenase (PhyH)